ncbi:MAG: ABC transporter permease [Anaerolineales bacterium]
MRKTLEIIRYELVTAFGRKSYLFIAFGVPVLAVIIFAGFYLFKASKPTDQLTQEVEENFQIETEGFIDYAGIVTSLPEHVPDEVLIPFANQDSAKMALENGEITAYYIIPADYVESGNLIYVHPKLNPIAEGGQNWVMTSTLYYNLLDQNFELASTVWSPANLVPTNLSNIAGTDRTSTGECSSPGFTCESNELIQLLPILIVAIIYVSIVTGGSYLLRLVSSEKDSRVMELLILSASPRQLLNGKVISYCILGFLQVLAWLGAIFLVFEIGGTTLNLPPGFSLPLSLLIWGLVFFLLGYAVYATIMAGAGALTPKVSQYTSVYFVVSAPLMISYFFSIMLAMRPHSPLAVGLSIFPLSAPVMMITRLTIGNVPVWQPLMAAGLTILMAILIMRAVARMFRAQILLSGQPFSLQRYLKILMNI